MRWVAPRRRGAASSRWRATAGIPAPAFSSSLAYYDGLRADRLPAALIQGQRDFFGAHTYQRVDKPGTFHTLWSGDRTEIESAGSGSLTLVARDLELEFVPLAGSGEAGLRELHRPAVVRADHPHGVQTGEVAAPRLMADAPERARRAGSDVQREVVHPLERIRVGDRDRAGGDSRKAGERPQSTPSASSVRRTETICATDAHAESFASGNRCATIVGAAEQSEHHERRDTGSPQ